MIVVIGFGLIKLNEKIEKRVFFGGPILYRHLMGNLFRVRKGNEGIANCR